tara:strand:+ start:4639 stop:5937 length:1299 start_codon:yes stop_codon:yes gene_type:complete
MNRLILAVCTVLLAPVALGETVAVVGGDVLTVGPAGRIAGATVVITDGLITAVGADVKVPADARVIDAKGKLVTPGLFTPFGTLGLVEVGSSAGPVDSVQRGNQFAASFTVADAFNPRSTLIAINRIEGVTRALIAPGGSSADALGNRSHVISGLAAVANLSGTAASIDKRDAALVVNLGEKGVAFAGSSRASALLELRHALVEAIDYQAHGDAYELGAHADYVYSTTDLAVLGRVINGEIPLLAKVDRASDIERLLDLADEFKIRTIVHGGVESWMVAKRLAAARVPVILAPENNLPANFDRINARSDLAAELYAAGVKIAFADGSGSTHNARNITQSAGNATVGGLPWDAALRAITLNPAEIYGVADRLGSIEVGKQGDIVVWPGDPFELTVYPDAVLIRGQVQAMKSRQTLLRDRYLEADTSKPPAWRH